MQEIIRLSEEYMELLSRQIFDEDDLDYDWFESQKPFLEHLSKIDHSAISVFDLHQKRHLYASENFHDLFKMSQEDALSDESINSRVHPEDKVVLMGIGIKTLRLYYELPMHEKTNFKLINEYRLEVAKDDYVRVIEQHKAFKIDRTGKVWLALSMVDLSPNQNPNQAVLSQVVNIKNGEIFSWLDDMGVEPGKLTKRESEVLTLAGKGLLSKEISDLLNISVHTVNTHRQRILEKMNANNTIEAIDIAKRFGLV
jgi:DNA-binding CsgD family transcriptional regulator